MGLPERIAAANLPPDIAFAFMLGLEDLGGGRPLSPPLQRFLRQTLGPKVGDCASPAPFEELWSYAELFLTSAILLSVASGAYDLEKARRVGEMAARLGVSAAELSKMEDRVFAELKDHPAAADEPDDPNELTDVGRR